MRRSDDRRRSAVARPRRCGFVLVTVLVVIAFLSLSAYSFTHWLTLEADVAAVEARRVQARYLAESGVALVETLAIGRRLGFDVPEPGDDPELFEGIVIGLEPELSMDVEDSPNLARFTVFRPKVRDDGRPALDSTEESRLTLGVEPEGGKINLGFWIRTHPEALREALLELPESTEEVVAAVLDWLDEDDERREAGAETDDYESRSLTITPRNGPIESLDELLLVRGMTPGILYGEDANRNGRLDANEDDGVASEPFDDADGTLNRGWRPFLTVSSRDGETDRAGAPRIDLNDPDLGLLYDRVRGAFDEPLARFVIAFRVIGPTVHRYGVPFEAMGVSSFREFGAPGRFLFRSPLELVDAEVEGTWDSDPVSLRSPIDSSSPDFAERLDVLLDRLTVLRYPEWNGRLDLLSASEETLRIVPGLTDDQRERILDRRPMPVQGSSRSMASFGSSTPRPTTLAWLITEEIVDLDELMALEPYVTAGSPVVRFQSVGFRDADRLSARIDVVLDRGSTPPRVLSWVRLDRWGTLAPLAMFGQGAAPRRLPAIGESPWAPTR